MRRALVSLFIVTLGLIVPATDVLAQARRQDRQRENDERQEQRDRRRREEQTVRGPLRVRPNAGPCPYVKILYDAARYVEFEGAPSSANVGWTGEIEGVNAECRYREAEPITVSLDVLFALGRGPRATGDSRTYRYWVAVTERNSAILSKQYFDLPVTFEGGADRTQVNEQIARLVIPRADVSVMGSNFEILIGFDVTPAMAEFNRSGSRFRISTASATSQDQ
ncbi:MAG TPA: Tat pathway signal sequence domain protein [Caulobacteraceae bacterium]|jgi:hypothetical protein